MYQRIMVIALMLGMICGIIFNFPANALDDKPTIYLTFDDGPSVYTSQNPTLCATLTSSSLVQKNHSSLIHG